MTGHICTWTLSTQQMVLHDYRESHSINFPASFRAQTKHYGTKMSNPTYWLKKFYYSHAYSFLLTTCSILLIKNAFYFANPLVTNGNDGFGKCRRSFDIYLQTVLLTFLMVKAAHINESFFTDWNSPKLEMAQNYRIKSACTPFAGFVGSSKSKSWRLHARFVNRVYFTNRYTHTRKGIQRYSSVSNLGHINM